MWFGLPKLWLLWVNTWILFLGEQMWDDVRILAGKGPPA